MRSRQLEWRSPQTVSLLTATLLALTLAGRADTDEQASAAPTFAADVAPLLYRNCARCHHDGGSAPFSLTSYEDARRRARQIAEVTTSRYMPPWKPAPGHGEFRDSKRLADDQTALLARWADAGAPLGDVSLQPDPPKFDRGWHLGEPDLVLSMDEFYEVPAEDVGTDSFRAFVIPTGFKEARYIKALDFQPDNPAVLHHLIALLDRTGDAQLIKPDDARSGFQGMLAEGELYGEEVDTWLPGNNPSFLPGDAAWVVPAGSSFVLDCHFNSTGKKERVKLSVAVYFTDEAPTAPVANVSIAAGVVTVPPGVKDVRVHSTFELPVPVDVVSILPHAHYIGKDIWIKAIFPDGRVESMIRIPDWDFNWQDSYTYVEPMYLPAGTVLDMSFTYDNTAENPRNPFSPPERIISGPRSADEMALLWLQVIPRDARDLEQLKEAVHTDHARVTADVAMLTAVWSGFIAAYDQDGSGRLSPKEDAAATAYLMKVLANEQLSLAAFDRDGDGRLDDDELMLKRRILAGWKGESTESDARLTPREHAMGG